MLEVTMGGGGEFGFARLISPLKGSRSQQTDRKTLTSTSKDFLRLKLLLYYKAPRENANLHKGQMKWQPTNPRGPLTVLYRQVFVHGHSLQIDSFFFIIIKIYTKSLSCCPTMYSHVLGLTALNLQPPSSFVPLKILHK